MQVDFVEENGKLTVQPKNKGKKQVIDEEFETWLESIRDSIDTSLSTADIMETTRGRRI